MIPPILSHVNGLPVLIIVLIIAGAFVGWLVWCAQHGGESLDRALADDPDDGLCDAIPADYDGEGVGRE